MDGLVVASRPRRERSLDRRRGTIVGLAAAQLGIAVVGVTFVGGAVGPVLAVVVVALSLAAVGRFPLPIELGRDRCTVTLTELVLAVALAVLSPAGAVSAAALGEAIAVASYGAPGVKIAYNACSRAFSGAVAVIVLAVAGDGSDGAFPLFAAILVAAAVDVVSTAAAIAVSLGQSLRGVIRRTAAAALIVASASGAIGVTAIELGRHDPVRVVLLVPVLALVAATAKRAATYRDDHLRTQRLYEAVAETSATGSIHDLLAAVTRHAAALTGAGDVVVAASSGDRQIGYATHDGAVVGVSDERLSTVLDPGAPTRYRTERVIAASVEGDQAVLRIVAVRGAAGQRRADAARRSTLVAYARQAHLAVTNALLVEHLRVALAHQIDLNCRKDEFVATVSHELRTPLTASIAAIQLVQRHGESLGVERTASLLETASDEAQRLHRLIDDLLVIAAISEGGHALEFETLAVDAVLESVRRTAASVLPAKADCSADALAPSAILADASALDRIVVNLLGNAAKYARGSGVTVFVRSHDAGVALEFADAGPGVPPEDVDRIFERFVQLDQSATRHHGGTGLGLSLSRDLARRMGGDLLFRPTEGGGATFVLVLPAPTVDARSGRHPNDGDVTDRAPALALTT